jgi:hypothetical protein
MSKSRPHVSFCTATAAALAGIFLSGCASVSLVKREWKVSPVPVPEVICVRPFTAELGAAKVDRADRRAGRILRGRAHGLGRYPFNPYPDKPDITPCGRSAAFFSRSAPLVLGQDAA